MLSMPYFAKKERRALSITIIVLLALLGTYPLMVSTLSLGHDCLYHISRVESIAQGLREGIFPVRLYGTQAFGFGYPSGICYPDLFLYIPAILVCIGLPLNTAYALFVFMVGILTASVALYSFSRVFSSHKIGVLLTILWTLAPYRLCCVFVRASVGEYLALAFAPLVVFGLWDLYLNQQSTEGSGWIPLALGVTGIVYSHVLSVALMGACGVLLLIPLVLAKRKRGSTVGLVKSGLTVLLLSAAFIVPFLHYYLSHDLAVKHAQNVPFAHAVEPAQLLSSFIEYKGASQILGESLSGEMPFGVGWGLIGAIPLAILYLTVETFVSKDASPYSRKWTAVFLGLSLVLMFCSTCLFPWDSYSNGGIVGQIIKMISVIQFPWRLLGVTSLMLTLLLGVLAKNIDIRLLIVIPFICVFAIVESGFAAGSYLNNAARTEIPVHTDQESIGFGEYLPSEVHAGFIVDWRNGSIPIVETGEAEINQFKRLTCQETAVSAVNQSGNESTVILPLFWHDQLVAYAEDGGGPIEAMRKSGYVAIILPPGFTGTVKVSFVEPLIWRLAELTSLAALVVIVILKTVELRRIRLDR